NFRSIGLSSSELEQLRERIIEFGRSSNPWMLLEGLDVLEINSQGEREDLCSQLLEKDSTRLAREIHKLGILDAEKRKEFFRLSAEKDLYGTLEHSANFDLPDFELQTRFARQGMDQDPHRLARIIGKIAGLSDQNLLGRIVLKAVEINAVETAREFRSYGLTDPEQQKEVFRLVAKRNLWGAIENAANFDLGDDDAQVEVARRALRRDPWKLLQKLPGLKIENQEFLHDLGLKLARSNVARTLEALPHLGIRDPAAFQDIVFQCARFDSQTTLRVIQTLDLNTEEKTRLTIVARAHSRPYSALEMLDELRAPDVFTVGLVFREAASRGPSKATRILFRLSNLSGEAKFHAALELSKIDLDLLLENISDFRVRSDADKAQIVRSATEHDIWRGARLVERLGIRNPELVREIYVRSASDDPKRAVRGCPALSTLIAEDQSFRFLAFETALGKRNIEASIELAKFSAQVRDRELTRAETLEAFDRELVKMKEALDPVHSLQSEVKLWQRVRRANCLPTAEMAEAFEQFDDSGDEFMLSLLAEAGETFGGAIISVLPKIYTDSSIIPETDRGCIKLFIAEGFRGFTPRNFRLVRTEFEQSPIRARHLLSQWKDTSSMILRGQELSEDLAEDPGFAAFVYSAYTPIGESVASVRKTLKEIRDQSDHVDAWKYKRSGYSLSLKGVTDVRLRDGEELKVHEISSQIDPLPAMGSLEVSESDFQKMLLKAAQGAAGQIEKIQLLAYLTQHDPDHRIAEVVQEIDRLSKAGLSERRVYEILPQLAELYDGIVPEVVNLLIQEQFEGGRLQFGAKLLNRIGRELRKPEGEIPDSLELSLYVQEKIAKVFSQESTIVKKESKKFVGGVKSLTGGYKLYLAKNKPSFFGRAGAGLCSADDRMSWNNPKYLQMNLVDEERGSVVGNIQLHIFTDREGNEAVLARLNPTSKFVRSIDKKL
ncbi:MAG: hypothetical protein KDD53_05990, partial [Bdellovibrionales bacterium]|nr:hypothetical protein [Bdellovibrionales bacterium]